MLCIFVVWVSIEPREINWLGKYIEQQFNDKNLSVKIDKTFISLSPVIDVKNVSVKYEGNDIKLPEISVRLSLLKLLKEEMLVSEVIVKEPEISAYIDKNNIMLQPFWKTGENYNNGINDLIKSTLNIVDNIVIKGAKFSVYKGNKEILHSENTDIKMRRYRDIVLGGFDIYLNDNAYINSKVSLDIKKGIFTIYGRIEKLKIDFFNDYGIDVPLDGGFNIIYHDGLKSTAFNFSGNNGKVYLPEYFDEPIEVKKIHADGYSEQGVIKINSAELELPNGIINAKGEYGKNLKISAELNNYKLDELYKHWSNKLSPKVRKWVTEHIKEGNVPKANINIDGDNLYAEVHFNNAILDYLSPLPAVNKVEGIAIFDNNSMDIDISYGEMLNGITKNATVDIKNFHDPFVDISIDIDSPLKDVWKYLSTSPLDVNLEIKPKSGRAKGKLYLQIPVAKDKDKINIVFKADADFKNASFYTDDLDITKSNGHFLVNNDGLDIYAEGKMNDFPATVKWKSIFKSKPFHVGNIDIMVDTNKLPENIKKYVKGVINVNAITTVDKTKVTLNLFNTKINFMGIEKQMQKKGEAKFNIVKKDNKTNIENLFLRWENALVRGDVVIKEEEITSANLKEIRFGNNDFALNYSSKNKGKKISLLGKSLDLYDFIQPIDSDKKTNLDIDADIKTVFFSSGEKGFKDVRAKILYENNDFKYVKIKGKANKPFVVSKKEDKIIIVAKDAGSFVKELGISDYMHDGILNGRINTKNSELKGEIIINDFVLKDAPALTQILSLASFTGILDTLNGSGIAFDEAYFPFTYKDDKFIIGEDAKVVGSAIGITLGGSVEGTHVDIHGTIIPSYTLNSFVSNIPIVGLVLAGTEDGVFAINYSVEGNYPIINVTVNPLSFLAPNIIKSLLGAN